MRTTTTRTIAGRVNADGTPANGGPWTSRKIATGQYTVTVPPGFRLMGAAASYFSFATYIIAVVSAMTESSFTVSTFTSTTGAAGDNPFTFVATGASA